MRFLIELDCSTETIRSLKHDDTVHRKLRLYEAYQDQSSARIGVVFVTSRSRERLTNILTAAATVVRNPDRTLFLRRLSVGYSQTISGVTTRDCPLLLDHRGWQHPLLPCLTAASEPVL